MGYRRYRRRYYRRRRMGRRRRRFRRRYRRRRGLKSLGRSAYRVPRNLGRALPTRLRVKLRYFETFAFTFNSAASVRQSFGANAAFKPNFTAAGHQPRFFDQLEVLYTHYYVVAASIKIKMVPALHSYNTTSVVQPFTVALLATNVEGPITTVDELAEYPNAKLVYTQLPMNNTRNIQLSMKRWTKQIMLFDWGTETNSGYAAPVTAVPIGAWYYVVHGQIPGWTAGSYTATFMVTLIQDVIFFNAAVPAAST